MNITCHSSFETNLRIRVSTPNGQKVVDTKHATKKISEPPRQQQHPRRNPNPSVSPPVPGPYGGGSGGSSRNEAYINNFQPQFTSFPFAQAPTTYAPEPPALQLAPGASLGNVVSVPELDSMQFNGIWGPFDFSAIDPDLGRVEVRMQAPVTLPPVFESFLPGTPASQHGYAISDSEASTSSNGPHREAPKEWIPRRRKRTRKEPGQDNTKSSTATIATPSAVPQRRPVGEAELYDHFRNCTQDDFINEQDAKWSFNRFVPEFVQKCSPQSPMRLAVLAWTAKHSATEEGGASPDPTAAAWYLESSEQVEKLFDMADPALELGSQLPVTNVAEVAIASSFFLNRYDVLGGDLDAASRRLKRMTAWLAKNKSPLSLSAFASKLLLWSCYLQVRIGIFSNDFLPPPTLLDVLTGRTDYHLILERSHNFYLDMFGRTYPQERLAEDVERIPAALHLHETFRLLTSILRYRTLRHTLSKTSGENTAGWEDLAVVKHTVDNEMQRVEADFDLAAAINPSARVLRQGPIPNMPLTAESASPEPVAYPLRNIRAPPTPPYFQPGKLSRVSLHWLTAYAAFMTTKILWSRLVRLDVRTDDASRAAVESILQIALLLRRSEGTRLHARELPSMLWPLPLFVAGIEAVDEVWADWVRLFITDVVADRGAENLSDGGGTLLGLMDEVRRRQDKLGTRIVVTDLMVEKCQTTDLFVF